MKDYTFDQHRHNYATWTAARAAQRGFTTTAKIKYAIEQSGLQQFAQDDSGVSTEQFTVYHQLWVDQITTSLRDKGVHMVTYGRAAKIISIYLKTSIILSSKGQCNRSTVIHPPIDATLLENLSSLEGLSDLKFMKWTQFRKEEYWGLVERLEKYFGSFDWHLEYYWLPK